MILGGGGRDIPPAAVHDSVFRRKFHDKSRRLCVRTELSALLTEEIASCEL
jgi:hypothetical protein